MRIQQTPQILQGASSCAPRCRFARRTHKRSSCLGACNLPFLSASYRPTVAAASDAVEPGWTSVLDLVADLGLVTTDAASATVDFAYAVAAADCVVADSEATVAVERFVTAAERFVVAVEASVELVAKLVVENLASVDFDFVDAGIRDKRIFNKSFLFTTLQINSTRQFTQLLN